MLYDVIVFLFVVWLISLFVPFGTTARTWNGGGPYYGVGAILVVLAFLHFILHVI